MTQVNSSPWWLTAVVVAAVVGALELAAGGSARWLLPEAVLNCCTSSLSVSSQPSSSIAVSGVSHIEPTVLGDLCSRRTRVGVVGGCMSVVGACRGVFI